LRKNRLSIITFLSLILLIVGCSEKTIETITDSDTKADVETVQTIKTDMVITHYMYDAMDRGNHDFFNKDIVIDTKYYDEFEVKRGDIIYFKTPKSKHEKNPIQPSENGILRVIGLSGEKVKIDQGQVFINDKKLDTFYGSFNRAGMNMDQYLEWRRKTNQDKDKDEMEVREEWLRDYTLKEITIPEGHIYVLGDDWFRSIDSKVFGTLLKENITGKVLGYK
jgi:signal peptidase I